MAQYMLKPLLGVLIARVFRMPSAFFAGFMLTCCVSGAQLSSYASFLGKGDVALSILLTTYSTISSVIVTPILTGLLIGSVVPVNGIAMAKSILQVVLLPVTLGLLLNTYAKPVVNVIQPVMPFVAMVCTSLCIGSPLAINRTMLLSSQGFMLLLPIVTFHIAAFVVGYWVSKLPQLRQEEPVCRTISVCTGMQSSTLAGLLATQFLGISQAVPAACSVVVMAIFGLTLASYWGSDVEAVSQVPGTVHKPPQTESLRDVIKLNVCKTRRRCTFGARNEKKFDYINRVVKRFRFRSTMEPVGFINILVGATKSSATTCEKIQSHLDDHANTRWY
ncbi:putative sodium-dependent transporter yocS [Triticum urartu]|uniref:Putative sodium-dependent transporter yocS n=1 Tax=Triticum urartu TaxID=4572 RepID=M7YPS7_TRIUA|nr:putative sodium-dependent transporter yocS [Triticum urartu]